MKRIVLCADDYGQAQHISRAILHLAKAKRISAISCLVNGPDWPQQGLWLRDLPAAIKIGLHLNLTEGKALSSQFVSEYGQDFPGLLSLLLRAVTGSLNLSAIQAEYTAQLNTFVAVTGKLPNFIDGHHHSHQFPLISNAVLALFSQAFQNNQAYIRCVREKLQSVSLQENLKKLILNTLGRSFKKKLLNMKIPFNQAFAGIYPFHSQKPYRPFFVRFIKTMPNRGGLIMCHPGEAIACQHDKIAAARKREYDYLSSPLFLEDCKRYGVMVDCFQQDKGIEEGLFKNSPEVR